MKFVLFVLLMIGFVSAADIELNCPDEIFAGEEFECSLEVYDGEGKYDVKIDLDGERNSVVQLWNDGEWKSGYYYLKEFIEGDGERDIRMKISEEGEYDGELKLRQGSKREFFDIEIEVSKPLVMEEFITGGNGEVHALRGGVRNQELRRSSSRGDGGLESDVIVLGSEDAVEEVDELVYVSKDAKIKEWLPYGFALFLIGIIGILLWERF